MSEEFRLEGLTQSLGELFNGAFVALIPSPVTFFLGFHEAGLLQNRHVVRDGGLGQVHALFDVAGAKADFLAKRTGVFDFESL